jgi:ArsR family transcriptional regulator
MNQKLCNSLIIFKALADETRLKIIDAIIDEPKTVSQLVKVTEESQSCVSHQLKTLKEAEIVKCERKGKCIYYSLADIHVKKIITQTFLHDNHKGDE